MPYRFIFFLLTFTSILFAQLPISELQKLQSEYKQRGSNRNSRILEALMGDSLDLKKDSLSDTLATKEDIQKKDEQVPSDEFSFYENLLRGQVINPDSILNEITVFGHAVFQAPRLKSFIPEKSISVPADYPVSAGDEIIISMWGRINEEHSIKINREGTINIPRIGPVSVAGLQFRDVQKKIINKIQSMEHVRAAVGIGELNDLRIYIIGEVNFPGQYTVKSLTNVTNALFYAEGFTKLGSMRNVKLYRNGKSIKTFDFYNFLMSGNNFSAIRLQTDDVIYVPIVRKMAAIVGNVRQSALYELKGRTTLKDLIALAGGLTPTAWVNRIQVERFQDNSQQIVFDLNSKTINELPEFEINDADIVKIFPVMKLDDNTVFLKGNVLRPGKYEYREGMRVSELLGGYDFLKPETYFDYAVIRRMEPPSFAQRIISFNLGAVLEDYSTQENILLKPNDELIVYTQDFFEPNRTVTISGAVTNPGKFQLLRNMRIKDLILEAGGLSEKASEDRGELYKRNFLRDSVRTRQISFSVNEAMNDNPQHNLLLAKFDHIEIRQKRGWEDKKIITFKGEFVYPGTYVVLEGETLGELIKRAGGFKSKAYLPAAIFTRESVKKLEQERNQDYVNKLEREIISLSQGTVTPEIQAVIDQQKDLLKKLNNLEVTGRIVINFEDFNSFSDLQIEDEDVLIVPKNQNTVSIIGEVFNPSTFVLVQENNNVLHYIELAGGYKENANKRDVYIIKANGSVRTNKMTRLSTYKLESGDAVVVPHKLPARDGRFRIFLELTNNLLAITTQSLLLATTIQTLTKE